MSTRIFLAPAGAGKTEYVLQQARAAARGLESTPRVILPSDPQVYAFRRRLAQGGGVLGLHLLTFARLYRQVLAEARLSITSLVDPVQHRLLRAALDELYASGKLVHYAPLLRRPGFVQALHELIGELKQGMVSPEALGEVLLSYEAGGPRLAELAEVYAGYQRWLSSRGWVDAEGMGWRATEALQEHPGLCTGWPLVLVDGFDSFNTVQLRVLAALAGRVGTLWVTLTGANPESPRTRAHKRFLRTLDRLQETLGVTAEPLPQRHCGLHPALCHVERALFERDMPPCEGGVPVEFLEAPNRVLEAREALRWCKRRIVEDGMRPGEVAIVARNLDPYRPLLLEVAQEFGLPVRLATRLPLMDKPCIVALMDLLRLMLPAPGLDGPELRRRLVVEAWRSPYFDWPHALAGLGAEPITIEPGDADALDNAARQDLVIRGWEQWREALTRLSQRTATSDGDAEEEGLPTGAGISREQAQSLLRKLGLFVQRLTPPPQGHYRDYVGWLEDLMGSDPFGSGDGGDAPDDASLNLARRLRTEDDTATDDIAALYALKEALRGLVWAEEALGVEESIDYPRFFAEIEGTARAGSYDMSPDPHRDDLFIADVFRVRGLSFRAVAVLGLAESEFPPVLHEDPLLREADRRYLREQGLGIDPRLESDERGYFYETVTRARERLLVSRPRLADDGSLWQPSPYWDELCRLTHVVEPLRLTTAQVVQPELAASLGELLESWALGGAREGAHEGQLGDAWQEVLAGAAVMAARTGSGGDPEFEGNLESLRAHFATHYGPQHLWSASRIESYRNCPFGFFIAHALGLERRVRPEEGFDVTQRGSILHRILELVYRKAGAPRDTRQVLELLPGVAREVLDAAPGDYGFRVTAWWQATRRELEELVHRNIEAMATLVGAGGWVPSYFEASFGGFDEHRGQVAAPLVMAREEETILLHGHIDRIDSDGQGHLRVIDYKSGGVRDHGPTALERGKKLQLALYALAARDALGLGEPTEGFYWHLSSTEPSGLHLAGIGPEEAYRLATEHAWEAVHGICEGRFGPHPPDGGCPPWCPAAGFCWRYDPRLF